jgi:histidinol dehydrogenase
MPLRLDSASLGFEAEFAALVTGQRETAADVDADVSLIISDVASRGDAALCELTAKFDRLQLEPTTLRIPAEEI